MTQKALLSRRVSSFNTELVLGRSDWPGKFFGWTRGVRSEINFSITERKFTCDMIKCALIHQGDHAYLITYLARLFYPFTTIVHDITSYKCVYPDPSCQLSLWEEITGAPGENPRVSTRRWLIHFTWVLSKNRTHELRTTAPSKPHNDHYDDKQGHSNRYVIGGGGVITKLWAPNPLACR